ncbi:MULTISPECIES: helix-turn-helix transcriptional regulator [Clostridium]|uniref:helix-turn-helix transcriptional regulator n=1 Tax=Clostridium TaxID=1485 RepID=UPI000825BE5B|nr:MULTISPECIES: helix-turn-helix transcriptional regulator [Clostridium]PJI08499.1 transcriptional regulator [Clostridium sp. CT7]
MGLYNILSSGDKIKKIRTKYGFNQEELAGSSMTRNLISEIEHNKVRLTESTAEAIVQNLNKLAEARKINVNISAEYLLEDEISQANKILKDYISKLKKYVNLNDNDFLETLKKCENFLVDWNIKDKKIIVYELAGDYFYSKKYFDKSILYYQKAFEAYDKVCYDIQLLRILRKMSKIYILSKKFNEGIECYEFAMNHFKNIPQSYFEIFTYNSTICYEELGDYDKALENLDKVDKLLDEKDNRHCDILINRSDCFLKMGDFKKALDICKIVSQKIGENEYYKKVINSTNLVWIYIKTNDNNMISKQLKIMEDDLMHIDKESDGIDLVYFYVGKIFECLHKNKEAEKHYLESLKFSKKFQKYDLECKILGHLIDLYIRSNDLEKIESIKNQVMILSNRELKVPNELLYKLIIFYSKTAQNDKIFEVSNFALNFKA